MPEHQEARTTCLHSRHTALGATMALFGGWDMPLWYKAGAIKEHLAVIQSAGLFDTSHMDVLILSGGDSRALLQCAFTRDLADARPGRAVYGAFLDQNGFCLDDAVVYPFADGRHVIVANASMGLVIQAHLSSLPQAQGINIAEPAERVAKIDIQGPAALRLVAGLFAPGAARELFAAFPYFSFKGDFDLAASQVRLADGTPVLLSRSGYTGELGFELFAPLSAAGALWDTLLAAGAAEGVLACGLAARDSLRTGAMLPLSHQDIGAWPFINHPWQIAMPLLPDGTFAKQFHGADALHPKQAKHTLAFAGFDPRRVEPHSAAVVHEGQTIGTVLTIVSDMAIGRIDGAIVSLASPTRPEGWQPRGLACGFVKIDRPLACGTQITLQDARREIKVEIVADIRPDRTARKKLPSL